MWTVPSNRKLAGKTFFVTCNLSPRQPLFAESRNAKLVVNSLQFFRRSGEMEVFAYVVMPDHIHFIARMAYDRTLPEIVRRFKNFVAKEIGIGPIWNKGYWSEIISGDHLIDQKSDYIHESPVRKGLVTRAEGWCYSSAQEMLHGDYQTIDSMHGYPCTPIDWKTAGGRR